MGSIGFKEWALVCDALGRGEQTVILRKGGIAEGREGFAFAHREFFLFPTLFHGQIAMIRGQTAPPHTKVDRKIEIAFFARVEEARVLSDWAVVTVLEPFHVLTPELVRQRFEYDDVQAIHVAFVRVYALRPSWRFPDEKRFAGCRSWVTLPELADVRLEPVLTDADHGRRLAAFHAAIMSS